MPFEVKQFLIQFEYSASTRWPENDREVAKWVASMASESVRYKTDGAFPLTTVFEIASPKAAEQGRVIVAQLKEAIIK